MRTTVIAGLAAVVVLAAAACQASAPDGAGGDGRAPGNLRIAHCSPGTLLPSDNLEVCGSELLAQLFTPLARADAVTGEPVLAMAERLESSDQQVWTVTLAEGWRFHDGEEVTSTSFVDAWNEAAHPSHRNARYLAPIEGFDQVQDRSAETLAGLEVLDERTFVVRLSEPFSQFPLLLGFNPYFPLPTVAFEDPAAYARLPVGNGPYRLVEPVGGDRAVLAAFEDYAGPPPAVQRATYEFFDGDEDAYKALDIGDVDVAHVPAAALDEAEDAFGERLVAVDGALFEYLALPVTAPPFDDARLRQALSLATDRTSLANDIRLGAARPAGGLVSPAVLGGRDRLCELCRHDPAGAAELLDRLATPVDSLTLRGGDVALLNAIASTWEDALGLDVTVAAGSVALDDLGDEAVLTGWVMDYPSPQNYLEPLYATGAPANYGGYANADVDALIARGNAAPTLEASIAIYEQAERLLLRDMPVIPLLFSRSYLAHGEAITTLVVDRAGQILLDQTVPAPASP